MQYLVRATDANGSMCTVRVEAPDAQAAFAEAERLRVTPVSVKTARSRGAVRGRFAVALFAQELHALIVAGLGVSEALEVLLDKENSPHGKNVLGLLHKDVREGLSFSAAIQRQGDVFPPLFAGIVQAAEGTSDLSRALSQFIEYEQRVSGVRHKVVSASIYPLLLSVAGLGVAGFLLGYVVPKFANVYRGSGRPLPWASRLLLDWGDFAGAHGTALLAAVALLAATAAWSVRRVFGAGNAWKLVGIVPGAGARLRLLELSRLYLTLGMLVEGGIPLVRALEFARPVLSPARRLALDDMRRRLMQGDSFNEALSAVGLNTVVAARLLGVGERSGQLGEMLTRAALFYEGDVTRWIERFTKVFEPALMAVIGIIIGGIVVLLYMPVFDLAGSFE